MSLTRASRLFHTVRYLKPRQIGWRLYYRLLRRRVNRQAMAPLPSTGLRQWLGVWEAPAWMPPCLVETDEFEFLGERGRLVSAGDWQHPGRSKLWLYNLHYLDDLAARNAESRFSAHRDLVARWVDENPPLEGNGWEPYTLSLRLVNLVKWLAGPAWQGEESVPDAWQRSLARQAQALSVQREYHILANHLFANGKALTFVGALLEGDAAERWLSQGLSILDAEIPEQFLADGGHFERSPMYHATLLWDLADLINLAECSGLPALRERAPAWRERLAKGLAWLDMMTHPDGEIGFFNDAAFGIAPTLADLKRYAERLKLTSSEEGPSVVSVERSGLPFEVLHAKPSGYVAVEWEEGGKALLDLAPVGPDYQPGHAHADTLSFELSLFGQRVLVNSGTSQYGEDAERHRQRSTSAHNTVTVDGENSSEVWAGFRVARRARPGPVSVKAEGLTIKGSHDGYLRLPGKVVHLREWHFREGALSIRDQLDGRFQHAESRFHCHPSVSVVLHDSQHGALTLPDGQEVTFVVEGGEGRIESSSWHPRFGEALAIHCLAVQLTGPHCTTTFSWA